MNPLSKFISAIKQSKPQSRPQTTEEYIEELVNRLILKLKADGKSVSSPDIADDFGAFSVYIYRLGTETAEIVIDKRDKWEVRVKPHFNKF